MKKALFLILALSLAISCGRAPALTPEEKALVPPGGGLMRVLTVDVAEDSLVLRTPCEDFRVSDLRSDCYADLAASLIATVTSPEQDGVGIAGPQVGLSRRVIAVQRFDKPGEPFEVYPNIRITAFNGNEELGSEGCLSVPGRRGKVMRYRNIEISYLSPRSFRDTCESVHGFTAVIFQHECDHLDGIIYTDRLFEE